MAEPTEVVIVEHKKGIAEGLIGMLDKLMEMVFGGLVIYLAVGEWFPDFGVTPIQAALASLAFHTLLPRTVPWRKA